MPVRVRTLCRWETVLMHSPDLPRQIRNLADEQMQDVNGFNMMLLSKHRAIKYTRSAVNMVMQSLSCSTRLPPASTLTVMMPLVGVQLQVTQTQVSLSHVEESTALSWSITINVKFC